MSAVMGVGGRLRTFVALVFCAGLAFCAVLVGAAGAWASTGFVHEGEFGSVAQPSFAKPRALAVDPATGDLLVVDVQEVTPFEFKGTISRFKPSGEADPFSALGANVIDGEGSGPPCISPSVECDGTPQHELGFGLSNPREVQIAIAPPGAAGGTAGDIYVTQPGSALNPIDVFAPSGEYLGQLTSSSEGAFGLTTGVAVDGAGAVYVGDLTHGKIHKYMPTANPVTNAMNAANFSRTAGSPPVTVGVATLAAGAGSTAGLLFSDQYGIEPVAIHSEGPKEGQQQCQVSTGESQALAVDSEDGHLFSASESQVSDYEGACAGEPEAPVGSFSPGPRIKGIAVDGPAGLVYVSREGDATVEVWEEVRVPTATTLAPCQLGSSGVTLCGEVNPNGQPLTECDFKWGETTGYGDQVPCAEYEEGGVWHLLSSPAALDGGVAVPVRATIPVESGTAYHAVLSVANTNGPSEGGDVQFRSTGSQVRGGEAREVSATTAQIAADIDPNGEESGFHVEYLSEAAYLANPEAERFASAERAPLPDRRLPVTIVGTGSLKIASTQVTGVSATAGDFGVGDAISGSGVPAGTTIVALAPGELTLSQSATATATGVALTATGPEAVTQLLTGLLPQTAYRFRVVAENGAAETDGVAGRLVTFALPEEGPLGESCPNAATRPGLSAGLPDCRAYEMVSPAHKAGEVIPPEPIGELGGSCSDCLPGQNNIPLPMQSAPDGGSVLYDGQPFGSGIAALPNDYLAGRGGSGWGGQSLSPATMTGTWEAFSEDLSRGIAWQVEPALAPAAPTRGGKSFANLYLHEGTGAFQALIGVEPPHRDPGPLNVTNPGAFVVRYAATNAGTATVGAFTHVLLEANDALTGATAAAPAAPEVTPDKECSESPCDLYEWSGDRLALVNVKPGNAQAAGRSAIGSGLLLEPGHLVNGLESNAPDVSHAISADGSRVFWSSEETGHVYARLDGDRTLEVPGPTTCKESQPTGARACFLTASADGSRVLLANGEIYELNGVESAYEPVADLTDGEGDFQGILGASEGLSRVYFVDTAVLTGVEANADGEAAKAGAHNLYAWHEGAPTRFIGRLVAGDRGFTLGDKYAAWNASPADRIAQVTPDGRYLAFMSRAALTGYDNMRVGGGECSVNLRSAACFEVFEYDAQTNVLSCASCNPSGQRPLGRSNLSLLYPGTHSPAFRQPQNLSPLGNGRLFFESQDVLAPQDVNGAVQDVYEWEPAGVGGCKKQDGCVALISSGGSANDSMFMDASATGNDAFLITRQQLVGGDGDQQLDLYDARVNGGFEEAGESTCAGEACKGPLSEAPAQPSIASQSFTGPGNPTPPTTTTPPKASKPLTAKKKTHRKKKSTKGKKGRRARAGRHKRHANTTRRGGRR